MLHIIVRQLRRLERSVGCQGATDNAASALADYARMLADIDDLPDHEAVRQFIDLSMHAVCREHVRCV